MSTQRRLFTVLLLLALLAPGASVSLAQPVASSATATPSTFSGSMLIVENAGQWPATVRVQAWNSPPGAGTTWLPSSDQDSSLGTTQPWPPDLTSLIARPFSGAGPPPPPPVGYVEPAGQLGGMTDAVAVHETLAYIGDGPRLLVLDVANPAAPVLLGQSEPLPDLVKGVAIAGDTAYVAAGEAGLHVFDVADPAAPVEISVYDTPSAAHRVVISGTTAFVAATFSGLQILDVAKPSEPRLLGSQNTPGSATGVVVAGNLAYISDLDFGLRIVDVANPAQPAEVGWLDTPGYAWGLDVAGTTAYVADERGGLRIVDVAKPDQPVEVGAYTVPTSVVGVAVSGTIAYLADWWSGLRIVDVSDPGAPAALAVFDTAAYALEVALQTGPAATMAYLADGDGGLRIVDVADPVHPVEIGSHSPLGHALNAAVAGTLVYVAGGFSGLRIVDAADPGRPREIGWYPVPADCVDVAIVGDTAYLATRWGGLLILDVGDPMAPTQLGYRALPGAPRSIAVLGNTAYVAADSAGLRILDVTDPTNPLEVGSFPVPGQARAVAARGSTAFVAAGPAGLALIDVSDPQRPALLSLLDTPGDAWDVAVAGRVAFVADGYSGVRVIDISDPRQPHEYQPIRVPGTAAGVDVGMMTPDGWPRVVYVAQGQAGLAVVDHGDPSQPIIASYDTPGGAAAVTVAGSTAFVADGAGGLNVLRLLRDRQEATITAQGGSLAAADASLIAIFPAGAFTETVNLTYERLATDENTGQRLGIGQTYRLSAVSAASGQPATLAPGKDYAVVTRYADYDLGPIVEESLQLRFRENDRWLPETSSVLHTQANALTALPQRLGWWTVLGETHRSYLPLMLGGAPSYGGDLICRGQGSITLWAGEGGDAAVIDQVLANWIAACPSIAVEVRYLSYGRLREEFMAAAAAGGGPDFLVGTEDWTNELVAAGLLKPLDGFPLVDTARYIPAAVEATRLRGQLYALPWYVQTIALLYNKELITAPPTTLDELLAAAASNGLAMNHDFYFAFWGIPAHGGAIFDEGEQCILDEAGFADWLDWLAAHQNDPGMTIDDDYEDLLDSFRQGNAALHPNGRWAIGSLGPDWAGKVGVAPLPAGPVGPAGPLLGVTGIMFSSVPNDSQTQLALQFARYLTGVEAQNILMDVAEQIPANVAVTSDDELMAGFMAQARTAYPFPTTSKMAAVWQPGSDAYRAVLQGRMTGQEAASAVCAAVDGVAVSSKYAGR